MKKLNPLILILSFLLGACASPTPIKSNTEESDVLKVTTSVASIQWLVDQIGGEHVQTQSLTTSGDDPHTYEPAPAQMIAMAQSDLYLTAGVEFESVWVPKFKDSNSSLKVVDVSAGINRIPIADPLHFNADQQGELDPHVWLAPRNMKVIAQNVVEALKGIDPKNSTTYQSNLENVLTKIDDIDSQLSEMLSKTKRNEFLIIHPSLGYFAEAYGLQMIPVEVNGQEPSPTELAKILALSQKYTINTLFTQTGTNPLNVEVMAQQTGIQKIVEIDPLAYDWVANMLFIGKSMQAALN
ncbi:MAG: zinc ABC transporter substrate-binding protein [Anaerolineaceae bacterium]